MERDSFYQLMGICQRAKQALSISEPETLLDRYDGEECRKITPFELFNGIRQEICSSISHFAMAT